MTEESALYQSTKWVDHQLVGYLPFQAANFLVGTGRYVFYQSGCWGYILLRIKVR